MNREHIENAINSLYLAVKAIKENLEPSNIFGLPLGSRPNISQIEKHLDECGRAIEQLKIL